MIRKMGEVMRGSELDKDAKDELMMYAENYVDRLNVPAKKRDELISLIYAGMQTRYYVRNTNNKGDINPKTGEEKLLLNPSKHIGYEDVAGAENRNKTQEDSAARARKYSKTVKEGLAEITPKIAEEDITELVEEVKDSNLKQALDRMVLTFSERLSDDKLNSERRKIIDRDIQELIQAIESDESYSQEDINSFSQFLSKLQGEPFFSTIHQASLRDVLERMRSKYRFDDSKNASWQDSLRKSRVTEAIKRFEEKHLRDEPMELSKNYVEEIDVNWKEVLKGSCGTEKLDDEESEEMEKTEAKPDFLDLDKDGNKKEPMKEAAKDAKKKPKSKNPFSRDD